EAESGSNGHRPIGNFLSTISEHDFLNRTHVYCWNLIGDRMVPRFSRMNGAHSLSRKGRAFFVGKPCWGRIEINARDSSCRGAWANRLAQCLTQPPLQLPICAIPASQLLDLCDVFRNKRVE